MQPFKNKMAKKWIWQTSIILCAFFFPAHKLLWRILAFSLCPFINFMHITCEFKLELLHLQGAAFVFSPNCWKIFSASNKKKTAIGKWSEQLYCIFLFLCLRTIATFWTMKTKETVMRWRTHSIYCTKNEEMKCNFNRLHWNSDPVYLILFSFVLFRFLSLSISLYHTLFFHPDCSQTVVASIEMQLVRIAL